MEFGVGEGRECGADWGKTTNSNVIWITIKKLTILYVTKKGGNGEGEKEVTIQKNLCSSQKP